MGRKKKATAVPEDPDWEWIGAPIPVAEVKRTWPHRKLGKTKPADYVTAEFAKVEEEDNSYIARAHYRAAKLQDGSVVKLGDDVLVSHDEEQDSPMRVEEMFEDVDDGIYFRGHYFYFANETVIANTVVDTKNKDGDVVVKFLPDDSTEGCYKLIEVQQDPRRLYWATDADNAKYRTVHSITAIDRVVRVLRIKATDPPPAAGSCEFWYDQSHCREYFTFRSLPDETTNGDDQAGPSHREEAADDTGVNAGQGAQALQHTGGVNGTSDGSKEGDAAAAGGAGLKKIRVMEMCAGVGGLSFLCQKGMGFDVEATWAVDIDDPAATAYQINHTQTHVLRYGIDEVLMMSRIWSNRVLPALEVYRQQQQGEDQVENPFVASIMEVTVRDCAKRGQTGQAKGHLLSGLKPEECWLEYHTRVRRGSPAVESVLQQAAARYTTRRKRKLKAVRANAPDSAQGPVAAAFAYAVTAAKDGATQQGGKASKAAVAAAKAAAQKHIAPARACPLRCGGEVDRTLLAEVERSWTEWYLSKQQKASSSGRPKGGVKVARREGEDESSSDSGDEREGDEEQGTQGDQAAAVGSKRPRDVDGGGTADTDEVCCWLTEPEVVALGASEQLASYIERAQALHFVPTPGNVDVLIGGPPCQGLSGLNRNAKRTDILSDPKNRLIRVYYEMVEWFKPSFTLTEQVLDMLKKESGRYARFATASLTAMRYQCRIGVLAAGDYGVAQGRFRCIIWGAAPGTVLPSLPEPTTRCVDFHTPMPANAKMCRVGFLSHESRIAAMPPTLTGDILDDLPPVDNFCLADSAQYAQAPTTPIQMYLRRPPPPGHPTLKARCTAANALMESGNRAILENIVLTCKHEGLAAVGKMFFNKKNIDFKPPPPSKKGSSKQAAAAPAAAVGKKKAGAKAGSSSGKGDKAGAGKQAAADKQQQGKAGGKKGGKSEKKKDDESEDGSEGVGAPVAGDEEAGISAEELKLESNFVAEVWAAFLNETCGSDEQRRQAMREEREAKREAFAHSLGHHVMNEVAKAISAMREDGPLRDHRPLQCNADDYLRMVGVPSHKNACFRQMAGVVTNDDKTCCVGHVHAFIEDGKRTVRGCAAGGVTKRPDKKEQGEDDKIDNASGRVDVHDRDGWRGTRLSLPVRPDSLEAEQGIAVGTMLHCPATTHWLPTGDFLCPRWCATFQKGKSGLASGSGRTQGMRQSCFGRIWYDEIQTTVVTRAEPHNLRIVHPTQNRVLSIRENARCQGFPDYWVLVGHSNSASRRTSESSVPTRYMQIGNAVAPPMAGALGRCLLQSLAAGRHTPVHDQPVISVPDPELIEAYAAARARGLKSYAERTKVTGCDGQGSGFAAHVKQMLSEQDDGPEDMLAAIQEASGVVYGRKGRKPKQVQGEEDAHAQVQGEGAAAQPSTSAAAHLGAAAPPQPPAAPQPAAAPQLVLPSKQTWRLAGPVAAVEKGKQQGAGSKGAAGKAGPSKSAAGKKAGVSGEKGKRVLGGVAPSSAKKQKSSITPRADPLWQQQQQSLQQQWEQLQQKKQEQQRAEKKHAEQLRAEQLQALREMQLAREREQEQERQARLSKRQQKQEGKENRAVPPQPPLPLHPPHQNGSSSMHSKAVHQNGNHYLPPQPPQPPSAALRAGRAKGAAGIDTSAASPQQAPEQAGPSAPHSASAHHCTPTKAQLENGNGNHVHSHSNGVVTHQPPLTNGHCIANGSSKGKAVTGVQAHANGVAKENGKAATRCRTVQRERDLVFFSRSERRENKESEHNL